MEVSEWKKDFREEFSSLSYAEYRLTKYLALSAASNVNGAYETLVECAELTGLQLPYFDQEDGLKLCAQVFTKSRNVFLLDLSQLQILFSYLIWSEHHSGGANSALRQSLSNGVLASLAVHLEEQVTEIS